MHVLHMYTLLIGAKLQVNILLQYIPSPCNALVYHLSRQPLHGLSHDVHRFSNFMFFPSTVAAKLQNRLLV